MENTLENKAKFFAQYLSQPVYVNKNWYKFKGSVAHVSPTYLTINSNGLTQGLLQLKPLSSITDEDKYYVGASVNCWSWAERKQDWFTDSDDLKKTHISSGKMFAESIGKEYGPGFSHPFAHNSTDILHGFDYLRSKGYALPWMGLSVEKQIEYGWIKLSSHE